MNKSAFHASRLAFTLLGVGLGIWAMWYLASGSDQAGHQHATRGVSSQPAERLVEVDQIPLEGGREEVVEDSPRSRGGTDLAPSREGSATLRVLIQSDLDQTPIPDAQVTLVDSTLTLLGETGVDGILTAEVPAEETLAIEVTHFEYATTRVRFEFGEKDDLITVSPRPLSIILGQVSPSLQSLNLGEVHVVAWPIDAPRPTRGDFDAWLRGDPSPLLGTSVDGSGAFRIENAAAGSVYRIVAGSIGAVSRVRSCRVGGKEVKLELDQLLGTQIRIRTQDGEVPGSKFPDLGVVFGHSSQVRMNRLSGDEPELALCNLDGALFSGSEGFDHLALFQTADESAAQASLSVDVFIPGYQAESLTLQLPAVADALSVREITLREDRHHGLGSIEFLFEGHAFPNMGEDCGPSGVIELVSEDQTWGASYEVASLFEPLLIRGIPHGNYTYQYVPYFGLRALDSSADSLRGNLTLLQENESVALDLSQFGALLIRIKKTGGTLSSAHVQLSVARASGRGGSAYLSAVDGRQFIAPVPVGTYVIEEEGRASLVFQVDVPEGFEIRRGEVTEIDLLVNK